MYRHSLINNTPSDPSDIYSGLLTKNNDVNRRKQIYITNKNDINRAISGSNEHTLI